MRTHSCKEFKLQKIIDQGPSNFVNVEKRSILRKELYILNFLLRPNFLYFFFFLKMRKRFIFPLLDCDNLEVKIDKTEIRFPQKYS